MLGVLLFDDGCLFCSRVVRFLERFDVKIVPISHALDTLSEFMGSQFPFALYFIPEGDERIYWGEDAVFMVMKKIGVGPFAYLSYIFYPILRKLNRNAERINRQRGVCGCMLSGSRYIGKEGIIKLKQNLILI